MKKQAKFFSVLLAVIIAAAVPAYAGQDQKSPAVREVLKGPGWTTRDNNLHQVDGPAPGQDAAQAYRLYRSGAPSKETFAKWCSEYGIARVIVMSGDAESHEFAYQSQGVCPNLKVVYNVKQEVGEPVSDAFLQWFDDQVASAKRDQAGLLFRCQSGSHRAGRLAAYYQMKYEGLSRQDAIAVMDHLGFMMPLFDPQLRPQVRALDEFLHGQPCDQCKKACVAVNSRRYLP